MIKGTFTPKSRVVIYSLILSQVATVLIVGFLSLQTKKLVDAQEILETYVIDKE